jgi:hypothetical protein
MLMVTICLVAFTRSSAGLTPGGGGSGGGSGGGGDSGGGGILPAVSSSSSSLGVIIGSSVGAVALLAVAIACYRKRSMMNQVNNADAYSVNGGDYSALR